MNLDACMRKHEIRNKELAETTGMSEGMISKIRKGKAIPSLANSIILLEALNFEVSFVELVSQQAFEDHCARKGVESFDLKAVLDKLSKNRKPKFLD